MKAAMFRGAGSPLEITDVPDPLPDSHGVVIEVKRCGICASDLHFTEGHSERGFGPNQVLGHEVAGEVVAVGSSVSRVKVGDRVAAMALSGCGACVPCRTGRPLACIQGPRMLTGGYAEYCVSGENGLIRLPQSLSAADGALVEPLAVALRAVLRCRMDVGLNVLVLGAGPIGLGSIFWARQLGAAKIAVGELNRDREDMARIMGADHFLVPSESGRLLPDLAAETLGEPPDVVIEAVGRRGMLSLALSCIKPGGTVGVVGYCLLLDTLIPSDGNNKEATIVFSTVYNLSEFEYVANALDRSVIQPRAMITDTIGLPALPNMFEQLRSRTSQVKVQVDPWRL